MDVLHAVLAGNDGCILCFGGALLGKSYTMVGLHGSQEQLGVIPSCVAWLYQSIAEQKVKSGARFSVRVSAVAVDATGANVKDLLGHYNQGVHMRCHHSKLYSFKISLYPYLFYLQIKIERGLFIKKITISIVKIKSSMAIRPSEFLYYHCCASNESAGPGK